MSATSRPVATNLRTVAVVLAGGVGSRAKLGMPKQLARIAGKPIMEHTIAALDAAACIDEIIVMMEPNHLDTVTAWINSGLYPKLSAVYPGGATRNDTTRLALEHLGGAECKVLFHDAVRPFINESTLQACVDALDAYGAVDVAIPSADTIVEIHPETGTLVNVPQRSLLRRGQTPQGFLNSVITGAYDIAGQDPAFEATDDCTVVLRYTPEVAIKIAPGSAENMKITEPIDLFIADKVFQLRTSTTNLIVDSHREEALTGKTLVIFGGSEGIGAAIADHARRFGANVHCFARSTTGTDVKKRKQVKRALREVIATDGRIDFVVNTAGILRTGELESFDPKSVRQSLDVNLLGPIIIAQEALPYLRETQGQLLLFTSSSYTRGRANYGMYSATKAATVNLTQSLGEEWVDQAVRINCINPERTATPMRTKAFGTEPEGTLLSADTVALTAIDTLIGDHTGQIVDVRRR